MLRYTQDDILESRAQTVVCPVNTTGAMDTGLAATWARRCPRMAAEHLQYCRAGIVVPGKLWLWRADGRPWILVFPTQRHWRNPSRLEYLSFGLEKFVATHRVLGLTHVAFPRLGCGTGGLAWSQVRPLMVQWLAPLSIRIDIHV